jgi:hypothetical protein
MSHYGDEFRACLGEILGTLPPPPEADALLFFKQWLAERNLGLVPLSKPFDPMTPPTRSPET